MVPHSCLVMMPISILMQNILPDSSMSSLFLLLLRHDLMYSRLAANLLCSQGWLFNFWSPSTSKCWDCRYILPYAVYMVVVVKPKTLCVLRKHSTNWAIHFLLNILSFPFKHSPLHNLLFGLPLIRNLMLLRPTTPSQLFLWVLNSEAETHTHAHNSLLIHKILGFPSPFHLPLFKAMTPAYPWLLLVEDYSLYFFLPENKKLNKVPSIPKNIFHQFAHSLVPVYEWHIPKDSSHAQSPLQIHIFLPLSDFCHRHLMCGDFFSTLHGALKWHHLSIPF